MWLRLSLTPRENFAIGCSSCARLPGDAADLSKGEEDELQLANVHLRPQGECGIALDAKIDSDIPVSSRLCSVIVGGVAVFDADDADLLVCQQSGEALCEVLEILKRNHEPADIRQIRGVVPKGPCDLLNRPPAAL
eukprot:CAMPEP_0114160170 /NCGR_PEP_ID=MMETSP0043_2-20121206/28199_1 /TAXON_ID=464988 /ORGANISM="Hemiselmis andersenii, Strain CCMP644" /LENGTH=135 /DNA_ID=CAMNT_0001256161 /DNA_START=98 /DNA_END=505 /DNA_ORIENTATION=-